MTKLTPRPNDFIYDVETYRYLFSCVIKHAATGNRWIFEVSWRRNDAVAFINFIWWLKSIGARMVGFNNEAFDYPVIHYLMGLGPNFTSENANWKGTDIIEKQKRDIRSTVYGRDVVVPQLDLLKIHHFDNKAKITGLKALEFAMRSYSIKDLPYPVDAPLTSLQIDEIIVYNCHDVNETEKFYIQSLDKIEFREKLSERMGKSFINYNDTKIGKDYFIQRLEKEMPGITGTWNNPRQTWRPNGIPLQEIILPYVQYQNPEFNAVLDYLKGTTIRDTRSPPELKELSVTFKGFQFDIGAGGLHGSVTNKSVIAHGDWEIHDVDVASFYPNLAIANRFFPLHLTEKFCDVYAELYEDRSNYPKGTAENEMLKLSLNGVYGESNNEHGVFLDPQFTMSITINGQLLLLMLSENLLRHELIQMIQANTDGVTVLVHKSAKPYFDKVCEWWQRQTLLKLEYAQYSAMHIRDVNSYMAVKTDGKVKRIGAYAYVTPMENAATREVQWHKDHSHLVVPKAAEACLVRGESIESFIWNHTDIFDFCIRVKAPRTSRLEFEDGEQIQNTSRVHMSKQGRELFKIMPPLVKKGTWVTDPATGEQFFQPANERKMAQFKGWQLHECNDIRSFDWNNLDRNFYYEEAHKLVDKLEKVYTL